MTGKRAANPQGESGFFVKGTKRRRERRADHGETSRPSADPFRGAGRSKQPPRDYSEAETNLTNKAANP